MTSGHKTSGDATATGLYAHADLAPGTLLASRFRIESLLGVGGMGVVYRATDEALGVTVALKLLRPELAARPEAFERFRQELLLARQVSNPHVVRIHDIAQHDIPDDGRPGHGRRWLISMDYVEGEALDKRLDRDGRLPPEDALRIARQVAEGLGAAHARGVVHRDLKPANVLIDRQGNAYVNDFGVARSLVSSGMTQSGAVVGTPDYLSPEQARGEAVDPRSDLYALGLILYEMLSGELPFAGGTIAEILGQRMLRSPPPLTRKLPELPAWIARLVDKLLRPQPAHRFQDAKDVIDAIDRREVPREFRPQRRGVLAAVALAVVAVVGIGAWWWMRLPSSAVAAAPPLQRLLVLPMAGGGTLPRDRLLAMDERLREALASAGIAVVDSERSAQALRQLDATDSAVPNVDAARRVAVADRALTLGFFPESSGWRVRGQLHNSDAAPLPLQGPRAVNPSAALQGWLPILAQTLGSGTPQLVMDLPSEQALDAYGAGRRAQQAGNPVLAARHFSAATAAAPHDLLGGLALAEAAQSIGDDDAAFAAIEQGQREAPRAPERLRLRAAAARALLEGDAPAAVAAWRALAMRNPQDTFAALNLARARGAGGDFKTATAELQALSRRDDNDPRVWFELGKFSILQGDARRAVDDYLVRALVLYKRSRDAYGQAETVNALGVGYGRLGQTGDAEEQYRKAVELRGALGNRRGVATSLRNLAAILSLRGKFDEAARELEQARTMYLQLGNRDGLAAAENELGLLHEERGDYRAALDAFRRALQTWQQVGDAHGAAETLNHIGFAHYQLGAYDSAQAFWQQAAEAYAKLDDQTGHVRTAQNLGLLGIARGHWDDARERLQESLAVAQKQQMLEEIAVSQRNLAELELWQGHSAAALDQAARAQALFRQREDQRGVTDAGLLRVQALLFVHANAQARQELDALAKPLQESSMEQRAIAAIAQAELARRDDDARKENGLLAQAQTLADASGVRQLQIQIGLLRRPDDPRLDADTAALGHAGLRLAWLERSVAHALATGDAALAVARYRESLALLRGGDYQRAFSLHALGANAFARVGETSSAATAAIAAKTSLQGLRAGVPSTLQAGFDAAPEITALSEARRVAEAQP